jgi:hypothetical protein
MAQRKAVSDGKTQHQRFVEAAKKLGADTDPEAFRSIVRRVATADTPTKAKNAARKRKA